MFWGNWDGFGVKILGGGLGWGIWEGELGLGAWGLGGLGLGARGLGGSRGAGWGTRFGFCPFRLGLGGTRVVGGGGGPGARPDPAWFPPVSPRFGGAGVVGGGGGKGA